MMNLQSFSPQRLSPIGLDINSWEIRAVQLSGSSDAHTVSRAAVLPRQEQPACSGSISAEDASCLRAMLNRRGFEGTRVVVTAPSSACSSQILSLPDRASGAPIEAIARAELTRARRETTGSFALAAWYLPQRGRGEQGMAVACMRPQLDERLDMLESAGLQPIAVDLEETALHRACSGTTAAAGDQQVIDVILHVGWDVSLGVITLGGVVVYTRRIGFGVADMVGRLAERSGIPFPDAGRVLGLGAGGAHELGAMDAWSIPGWNRLATALGKEIDTSVTYVSHAYRNATIGRVVLAGFGSHRGELCGKLDEALGMPAIRFGTGPAAPSTDPSLSGVFAAIPEGMRGRIAVAYGLAGRFDV